MRRPHAVTLPAELEPARVDATAPECQGLSHLRHRFRRAVVAPWPGFDERLGALEIGLQLLDAERPTGMAHPGALFEVDRIKRPAPAAPMVAAAAQIAHARRVERQIRHARHLS